MEKLLKLFRIDSAVLLIFIIAVNGCGEIKSIVNSPDITIKQPFKKEDRIAVLSFYEAGNASGNKLGNQCANRLNEEFLLNTNLTFIDRSLVNSSQMKNKLLNNDHFSLMDIQKLGESLKVTKLICGTVEKTSSGLYYDPENDQKITVSCRVLDVATGEVLALARMEKSGKDANEMISTIAGSIVSRGNWVEKEIEVKPVPQQTDSLTVLKTK